MSAVILSKINSEKPIRRKRGKLSTITASKFQWGSKESPADIFEEFDHMGEDSVPNEPEGVNRVHSFESKFNFTEKKGKKRDPNDFNLLAGDKWRNQTYREKDRSLLVSRNKLSVLPIHFKTSKMSTDASPVSQLRYY